MYFLLCVIYLKILVASSQFPNHMDLQYFGDVTSNKEKYKILKPTVHIVEDYFKSYMLRTKDSKFLNKKVLLDDNGFRHHWEDVKDDSRKAETFATLNETHTYDVNENKSKVEIEEILTKMRTIITNISEPASEKDINKDSPVEEITLETQGEVESSTLVESVTQNIEKVKEKPNRPVTFDRRENKSSNKKKVKTSFFCPFFGVITMTSYID